MAASFHPPRRFGLTVAAVVSTAVRRSQAADVLRLVLDTASRFPPSGLLVGGAIEDVNNELYGGLYSQMIFGESFEEPASDGVSGAAFQAAQLPVEGALTRPTWMPWSSTGSFAVSRDAFDGEQSQSIADGAIANFGLGQQGMHFVRGREYEGHVYVKSAGGATLSLKLTTDGGGERRVLAEQAFHLAPSAEWRRLNISLVPDANTTCGMTGPSSQSAPRAGICGYFGKRIPEIPDDGSSGPSFRSCYQCTGGFVIEASGGEVLVDTAFLQPGPWGRYKGLPVRRDVAQAMFETAGWQGVRLGGSMCSADGYRWKAFRGFPRQPYRGAFHPYPSRGFGIFEVLALCEAAGAECAITVNSAESPADMADLVEYCHGGPATRWGALRAADGHPAPYRPFRVEIGNEMPLGWELVDQVSNISRAMAARAAELNQPLLIAVGQNMDPRNFDPEKGLNITKAMLDVLEPLKLPAAWDTHIGGDDFGAADGFQIIADKARDVFAEGGHQTRLVVYEENGFTHDLKRALVHSREHITASYLGGFFLMDTAANGLQVFGQNDDGWDQGQVFMTPDAVWLSPFGWSQAMLARHAREFKIPVKVANGSYAGLEVGAYVSDDGANVGLRVVNWARGDATLSVQLPWTAAAPPDVEAEELTSSNLTDVNPPSDPKRVAPRPLAPARATLTGAGTATVELAIHARSLVTVTMKPSVESHLIL